MKKLNKTTDIERYLKNGALTEPFLDTESIKENVFRDYKKKNGKIEGYTPLHSLFNWIDHCTKFGDKEFNAKNRFQRTAQEIWESQTTTACSDYAILFATFARQLGYPTTFLHTAEEGWLKRLKNNGEYNHHCGHSFCEVFYEGKWVLVDPTFRKIETDYNPSRLILSYKVGQGNIYIPYQRDLDLGVRQSTKEHNLSMDKYCRKLDL